MKTYLKSTILLFLAILLVVGFRSYYRLNDIDKQFRYFALKNSQILANITQAHLNVYANSPSNPQINTLHNSFDHIYKEENYEYQTQIVTISKENLKTYTTSMQEGFNFLIQHPNEEYFFKHIKDAQYFYLQRVAGDLHKKTKTFLNIKIDTSKEKNIRERKFIIVMLEILALIFIVFGVIYKYFKTRYLKEEELLLRLKDEIKRKNDHINKKNSEIIHRFFNDDLTNLPNRNSLIKVIQTNNETIKCVVLINLDNFKEINDFYGFEIGDEVLVSFGNFLKLHGEKYRFSVYRLHADEFALLSLEPEEEKIKMCVDELLLDIKNLSIMTEEDYDIEVQATLGISTSTENLLSSADMVLKKAKSEHLSYLFFDPSLKIESQYKYNLEWTKKIKRAIKREKIIAYCQPIVKLNDKNSVKFEILARMQDNDEKIISPFAFLEVAKRNKLYPSITRSIIKQAFDTFKGTDYSFSINLSILDILDINTIEFIIDALKSYPNPENINFEILESEGIENFEEVSEFIKLLKQYKCKISIDDFGSGYSNFEYILNLQVDMLKIDASLIKNIDKSPNAHAIVETIVSFANKLNIETCAEFVHSKEVYDKLLEIKTTYVQGYYISEPFNIKEIQNYKPK